MYHTSNMTDKVKILHEVITTCNLVMSHTRGYWLYGFQTNIYYVLGELLLKSGGKCKGSHFNDHHVRTCEFGTTTLLSELPTLIKTSSSEPSMELKISTASGMHAGKTQTLKYVSHMLFLVQIVGHTNWLGTFLIALVFILFQLIEKSYLGSMT
jgi:hypothetical protein